MIEMRWIEVPAGSGRGLLGKKAEGPIETVLQYRYDLSIQNSPFNILGSRWSEWVDVPLGREDG